MRSVCRLSAFAVAVGLGAVASPALSADPLTLESGQPIEIRCETQATQVAPEAKISAGALKIRVERKPSAPDAVPAAAGTWTPLDRDPGHDGSLAERHREACKSGCPLYVGLDNKGLELWFPRRSTLDRMAPGELLTIAVIDATTLKLKASTFLDQQIASLEQGDCQRLP